ncbi:MAG: hypothetical protein ACRELZ_21755 [Candidatus Rokuibacteriota bacterium]
MGAATPGLPAGLDQEILLRHLTPLARSADIFFLLTDDPVKYRIDVLVNETLPPGFDREFEPLAGAFRLEAPHGRVALIGWDTSGEPREAGSVSVSPGAHLLSVFTRRPFDGKRHAEDRATLLGADAKFMQRVDRLGVIGCLPLVLVALCVLTARWRWLWYLVPVLVISWLPYLILKRGRRYRSAERRASDAELARPHYVISLRPTQQEDVRGGYARV